MPIKSQSDAHGAGGVTLPQPVYAIENVSEPKPEHTFRAGGPRGIRQVQKLVGAGKEEISSRNGSTYVSLEQIKSDFSFHILLAFLQTESHIIRLRAVPVSAVHLVSKLP